MGKNLVNMKIVTNNIIPREKWNSEKIKTKTFLEQLHTAILGGVKNVEPPGKFIYIKK